MWLKLFASALSVVYFNQLLGAARTQKLNALQVMERYQKEVIQLSTYKD